ncbi:hypothetical protein ACFSSF_01020 [Dietzia aerolata]|uniref:hypothetical protein n=1 Tax=Dietzia aerolata TaxID=595984 RepID=UPI003642C36B
MNDVTARPIAERVRTVLARGASGTVEAGILRRPLRSARVRDDGVVVLVVDVSGMSREVGDGARMAAVGASATVEIPDAVCTGRCRKSAPRPSFALDGRHVARPEGCDDDCSVVRGIVTLSGIVTASSDARRRLVAADGGPMGAGGDLGSIRLNELQPLEITYLGAEGWTWSPARISRRRPSIRSVWTSRCGCAGSARTTDSRPGSCCGPVGRSPAPTRA